MECSESADTCELGKEVLIGSANEIVSGNEKDGPDLDELGVGQFVENLQLQLTPDGRNDTTEVKVATPAVGMTYQNWKEIDLHFRCYAKQCGFAVSRVGSGYRQKDGMMTKVKRNVTWRCEQWGENESDSSTAEIVVPEVNVPNTRARAAKSKADAVGSNKRITSAGPGGVTVAEGKTKKCNCPVMVYVSASRDGSVWTIKKAMMQHEGHVPSPSKNRYISVYRLQEWNPAIRRRLFIDLEAGIKITQIHRGLASERNGIENFALTQRDLRNAAMKKRQMEMRGGDANAMYAYLRRMSEDNDKFYYEYRLHADGSLKDVMWVDARSRAAYECFGDVVCFDSTYITNDFELPFANFVGVNHHGQTILFGCALLSHEDCETFVWLFSKWKDCMGKAPVGILTDQDAAMKKALSQVMPETRHRWCLWHILQKFHQRLGAYEHYETISDQLQNAIYDSLTPEEFNDSWSAVIDEYKLHDNEWLQGLFEKSEMWIPAHMKHLFWAGMKTTQRSESINSFFDNYVTKKTRLYQFVKQYVNAMESRINDERAADADSSRNLPHTATNFPLEKTFRKFYTNTKFKELQRECVKTMYVRPVHIEQLTEEVLRITLTDRYYILNKKSRKEYATDKRRQYVVHFNKTTKEANCVCMLFECHGLLCRHIIAVYDSHDVSDIPQKYILDRWRKDIKRAHTRMKIAYYDPSKTEDVKRLDRLNVAYEILALEACIEEEDVAIVMDMIEKTKLLIAERRANAAMCSGQADNIVGTPSSVGNEKVTERHQPEGAVATDGGEGMLQPESSDEESLSLQGLTARFNSEGPSQITPVIKDPPMKKKPAHRTRERRYLSCVEKSSKPGRKRSRAAVPSTTVEVPPVLPHLPLLIPVRPMQQQHMQSQIAPNHQPHLYSMGQPNYQPRYIPDYGGVMCNNNPYQQNYVPDLVGPFDNAPVHYQSTQVLPSPLEPRVCFPHPRPFGMSFNHSQPLARIGQYSQLPDWYIRDCELLNLPDSSDEMSNGDSLSTPCGSTT